jgi:two-component system sensor histidine kinase CpxA
MMRDVSHELRSPLARLQALLSIARQAADTPGSDRIDRMEKELERLDELIGEILTFSRLEARTGITRKPTDVVDLVQNIVDDARLEGQATGKQIQMSGPEQCVIELDGSLIQSAVENVIRNALKYTAEDTAVEVDIIDQASGVRIVIDDHGPGVPEEAIDQIFEPFFRVGEARGTRSGSGGIGLAIAERSVRLHGGTVTARNRDGAGLRVEIDIPALSAV